MNKFRTIREWNEDNVLVTEIKESQTNSYSYGKYWYDNGNPSRSWTYIEYLMHYEKMYHNWNIDGTRNYVVTYKNNRVFNGCVIFFNYNHENKNTFESEFPKLRDSDLLDSLFG